MRDTDKFEGRTQSENNPPWEISPWQAWREQVFHRETDPLARDDAVQRRAAAARRKAQEAAQAQRKEAHEAAQTRRREAHEAFQTRRREAHAAAQAQRRANHADPQAQPPAPPAPPAVPPLEDEAPQAKPAKKKHSALFWVLLVLLICVGAETVVNVVRTFTGFSVSGDVYYEDGDDGFFYYYDDGEEDGLYSDAAEEAYEPPAYTRDSSGLAVTLVSSAGKTALTYQELYAKCLPSMVSITVTAGSSGGTGSGIILTEDGYILTCNHVVEDSETCTVLTYDDTSYTATLVGSDAQTDLAILKIEAAGLTPAEFGNSDELQVGDEALVIGDPLGSNFRGTLTNGIISGINRSVSSNGYAMTLIQTTAAVNSGNSGGALFNIYGQVVGVVNLKMVTSS
ncbi:MAG: trypsin-like peptidase domain-containing protein, partial [Clostridiales bacterium]|nr:trypsin-like peptidase domain-containing protein [Clostridiales bacterium]